MSTRLPSSGKMARIALLAMGVLWSFFAMFAILFSLSRGWDGFRIWMSIHFGWAGIGSFLMAILLAARPRAARILSWFVLPFCIVLFPIGPALAIYAAWKLERPEMKEFFAAARKAPASGLPSPPG